MSGIFLDTGYLIALISKRDYLHNVALEASKKFRGPFLTTQLILVELANSLCFPAQRVLAVEAILFTANSVPMFVIPRLGGCVAIVAEEGVKEAPSPGMTNVVLLMNSLVVKSGLALTAFHQS